MASNAIIVNNEQGRNVGQIEGRIFTKSVMRSKHLLRSPAGWGIDKGVFDRVIKFNCDTLVIIDRESQTRYTASVSSFLQHKIDINRGFGLQYVLELIHWQASR